MAKHKKRSKNKEVEKSEISEHNQSHNLSEDDAEEREDSSQNDEVETSQLEKRIHTEHDSDSDIGEPKKKKKKKKPVVVEETSTNKKNKISNRQRKKEKHAQRQAEMQAAAKDQLKSQCLQYLSQWQHDKTNWKFMKAKQTWLFKNKFSPSLLPNESWPLLMEYFESAKGNIRNMLLEDANKIIKQMDDWTETQDKEKEEAEDEDKDSETKKPDERVYKRARDLIQCLEE